MKSTIVLAVLLAGTPAFAQYGYGPPQYGPAPYGYGQGSPGATMQDYRLAPHQRTTRHRRGIYGYTQQRVAPQRAAPQQTAPQQPRAPEAAGGGAVKQPMGRP